MKNTSFLKKLLTRIVLADILTIVPVRGYSSAGRALDWQSRGQRFDPANLHQRKGHPKGCPFSFAMGIPMTVRCTICSEAAVDPPRHFATISPPQNRDSHTKTPGSRFSK